MNIQLVGLDSAEFEVASDAKRIEWAKSNNIAGIGLCPEALELLKQREAHVVVLGDLWIPLAAHVEADRFVYRLKADYAEPGQAKWWFNAKRGLVYDAADALSDNDIEVTAEKAAYLANVPTDRGPCKLGIPRKDDVYLATKGVWITANEDHSGSKPAIAYFWVLQPQYRLYAMNIQITDVSPECGLPGRTTRCGICTGSSLSTRMGTCMKQLIQTKGKFSPP